MELTLKRLTAANKDGVPGVLMDGANIVCLTLEEEDQGNRKGISCIPPGSYLCRKITRPSGMVTYEVTNVPGRSAILFHPANTEEDLQGCVATGLEFGELKRADEDSGEKRDKLAVLRSVEAFEKFMKHTGGRETFALTVKWC